MGADAATVTPPRESMGGAKDEDLADKVRAMLFRMRCAGFGLVCIAAATQVPWVLAASHFSSALLTLTR